VRARPLTAFDKEAICDLAKAYEGFMFYTTQLRNTPKGSEEPTLRFIASHGKELYERQRDLGVALILDVRAILNGLGIPADENCCAYGAKPSWRPPVRPIGGRRPALSPEQAQSAKDMYYRDGLSMDRIARHLGVSHRTINTVIERKPPYDKLTGERA
jgi:hypothetical protein